MRIAAFVLAFGLLMPLATQAEAKNIWDTHPDWFNCEEDDQCALSCQHCGYVAVNKMSLNNAAAVIPACLQSTPCFSGAEARCVNHQCMTVVNKREGKDDTSEDSKDKTKSKDR